MSEDKKEIEKLRDVKYANWNRWYDDLAIEIKEIRQHGHVVLFVPKEVNQYYSRIVNLYSSIEFAIDDDLDINKKLDTIEKNIFSHKYIRDLNNSNVTDYQRKVIKSLRNLFSQINKELSKAGFIPKVIETEKDTRPGAARS